MSKQDCGHTKNINKNRINKKRSSSNRFTFGATGGLPPFAFDCILDGMPVGCGTFTNLAAGQHTFSVAPVDNSVNQDPQPPVCRWTIYAVIQTNQLIHCMHLDFAIDRILDAQLNAALQFRQRVCYTSTK